MNQSVSYTFLLNIIITFILLTFMVLMATLSYTKAYRVSSKIADAIEACEGYNSCSIPEIDIIIDNYGYQRISGFCPKKNGKDGTSYPGYCIYEFNNDGDAKHYSYAVMTYMYIDMPIINNLLRIPVYARTDRIYDFT